MTNEFLAVTSLPATVEGPVLDPATALLDEMMARVGVDGLAAALVDPGVLALVDQHAAAAVPSGRIGGAKARNSFVMARTLGPADPHRQGGNRTAPKCLRSRYTGNWSIAL